ncbi:hypothetical protein Tco_0231472 [Tanacetum coccineum]|uniref:Reverse transcriptase domain-containing protein n=1 Tax=Tanacetum coccineum TaxID=301880 RepID=A0ABQ5CML1_9ASTR
MQLLPLYHHYTTPLPPSLSMPSPVDRRDDIPESEQPPRKRLHLSTIYSRYEIGESSTARPTRGRRIDYGFVSTCSVKRGERGLEMLVWDLELGRSGRGSSRDSTYDRGRGDVWMWSRRPRLPARLWARSIGFDRKSSGSFDPFDIALRETYRSLQDRCCWNCEPQRRARQPGPEARISDHQDASGVAEHVTFSDLWAEGVVGLTRWIEKMESVFNISGCAVENQVKFATCTLLGAALTWWNGQIRTLGPEAYAMTWEVSRKSD